jgi:predicted RNase H-like HicB family nuclease
MNPSRLTLIVEVEREVDGRWIAEIVEMPGVLSYGVSPLDAVAQVKALAVKVIEDRIQNGESAL